MFVWLLSLQTRVIIFPPRRYNIQMTKDRGQCAFKGCTSNTMLLDVAHDTLSYFAPLSLCLLLSTLLLPCRQKPISLRERSGSYNTKCQDINAISFIAYVQRLEELFQDRRLQKLGILSVNKKPGVEYYTYYSYAVYGLFYTA
jgi:hypothetical protein